MMLKFCGWGTISLFVSAINIYPAFSESRNVENIGIYARAYYGCIEAEATTAAETSNSAIASICRSAREKCFFLHVHLVSALAMAVGEQQLTELGGKDLLEKSDRQAFKTCEGAIANVREVSRTTEKRPALDLQTKEAEGTDAAARALAVCSTSSADEMALASDEPAESVAKAAAGLCWKEAQAFAEADARTAGQVADTNSIEQAQRVVANRLISRIIAARAAERARRDRHRPVLNKPPPL